MRWVKADRTDWFLFGIVVVVVVLVAVAFVVSLTRPEPTYKLEDTPEGVAHNYLLALRQGDLERSYRYISPMIKNYPVSASQFTEMVMNNRWMLERNGDDTVTLQVESSMISGHLATVYVREARFYSGGLFSTGQDLQTFRMQLRVNGGNWKITDADRYWLHCLAENDGCRHD